MYHNIFDVPKQLTRFLLTSLASLKKAANAIELTRAEKAILRDIETELDKRKVLVSATSNMPYNNGISLGYWHPACYESMKVDPRLNYRPNKRETTRLASVLDLCGIVECGYCRKPIN